MALQVLFQHVKDLAVLGTPGHTSLETVTFEVEKIKKSLWQDEQSETAQDGEDKSDFHLQIHTTFRKLLSAVNTTPLDVRLECGFLVVAILQGIQSVLGKEIQKPRQPPGTDQSKAGRRNAAQIPPAPPDLISVQQAKDVEAVCRVLFYTAVLGCLDNEASLYVKMMLAKNKFILGSDLPSVPQECRHAVLSEIFKSLLPVMKHETLGTCMRGPMFPEVLSSILQLCFGPVEVKNFPEDTAFFRDQMESLFMCMDTNHAIRQILLLKGLAQRGVWFKKVCGLLLVRRFMFQPGGVAAVIGAGLSICNGKDWQQCEAVASLIAQAKISNMDQLYSTAGPQIAELLLQEELKPEILRVVVLTVAQMARRSASLTALHVTHSLLKPLVDTTTAEARRIFPSSDVNLTLCITRIHKLFVEIATPTVTLTSLLQPVLCPLMAVAALMTSHLRSKTQQILVRYLSQQQKGEAVETLLVLSGLQKSSASPSVDPRVEFSVDDEGGVKVTNVEEVTDDNILENDDRLSKSLITVLETLKNRAVILEFYERLAECINFTVLNEKKQSPTLLLTDEDVRKEQFEGMRKVSLGTNLLSLLADSDALTNDLFQDLSAAVPFVDRLIKAGCQECNDEHLRKTQTTLVMNIVVLISCYVSERTLRKKMSSEDWKGLKNLVPSLDEVGENIQDETVLLYIEQLRNLLLTHGVVQTLPGDIQSGAKQGTQEDVSTKKGRNDKSGKTEVELDEKDNKTKQELNRNNIGKLQNKGEDKKSHDMQSQEVKSTYKEAMDDLFSPLLPVRGHSLLALGKLIEQRDPETLLHKDHLLTIFQHNLKDEDSYIYLMAVQGLSVLCDAYPDKIVGILTAEFSVGERTVEDRAKLAEALTRASRRLGPLLPHYKEQFINALLAGVRDGEPLVRAASLSSLGDVIKLLRFSIGPIVHEVFQLLHTIISHDKEAEVRRAAVLVITLLLQGLGQDAFSVLKEVIRDLYRALRLVHTTDPDDVVRLHAQLAMEEIDTITRAFLLPKLSLSKKIYVTEMPPSPF
ncbi:transport and Golgi organization protein 6 homolog isoform X1 [Penaeus chinensis]|uniref:transport and Golgi organization protein 6 homolog isoform X1 n=2 Tax=Penaeus chinensis TaxID=139456 RepID=UPI001FB69FFA|nr:transport and Golgi organization protein 6 homolog isoform X1 [Penaeus chinensis]